MTQRVQTINSTYNKVRRNLEILRSQGIVKFAAWSNIKIVELERDSPKTQKLLTALHTLQRGDTPDDKE